MRWPKEVSERVSVTHTSDRTVFIFFPSSTSALFALQAPLWGNPWLSNAALYIGYVVAMCGCGILCLWAEPCGIFGVFATLFHYTPGLCISTKYCAHTNPSKILWAVSFCCWIGSGLNSSQGTLESITATAKQIDAGLSDGLFPMHHAGSAP